MRAANLKASAGRSAVCSPSVRGAHHARLGPAVPTRNIARRAADLDINAIVEQLNSLPQGTLVGGGIALASLVGFGISQNGSGDKVSKTSSEPTVSMDAPPLPPPRENAVIVFGSTGRVGKLIVKQLLARGRTVIAAIRTIEKGQQVLLTDMGLTEGRQAGSDGILFLEQVDVTGGQELLSASSVWQGASQVVLSLGAVTGRKPDGTFGYFDDMSPERVEGEGIPTMMAVLPSVIKAVTSNTMKSILPMDTEAGMAMWQRMDDVIMGGQSKSVLSVMEEGGVKGAKWAGNLILEGGGFCGARTKQLNLDLSMYDGIYMRVKGDGQIFKMNIKTTEQLDAPESTYQTTFDTVAGQWSDVYLPWHNFAPVKRANYDCDGEPLDPSKIQKMGLILSRFEFNKAPNPSYKAGTFELLIDGGISAFSAARPQVVMVSSAGVERNAKIGDNFERRMKDIPIVRLNPGGTLNHKYTAELAVRASGYPYAVLRTCGHEERFKEGAGEHCLLEGEQGDVAYSGYMTRGEVAALTVASLEAPEVVGKTFEVKRCETPLAQGMVMGKKEYTRLFLRQSLDMNRWRVGLMPFPKAVPPPRPLTEEEVKELLTDPRIKAQDARNPPRANLPEIKVEEKVPVGANV